MKIPYSVPELEIILMSIVLGGLLIAFITLNVESRAKLLTYVSVFGLLATLAITNGMWVLALATGLPTVLGLGISIFADPK